MIIALTGRAAAGKDATADIIEEITTRDVHRVSFAAVLYESAAAAIGVTPDDLRRWKSDEHCRLRVGHSTTTVETDISIREYLQFYGTEAHRNIMGEDFWVDIVADQISSRPDNLTLVTDCRFPNEARACIDAGAYLVEVLGPATGTPPTHRSERGVDWLPDFVIHNQRRDDDFLTLRGNVIRMLMRIEEAEAMRFKWHEPLGEES